MDSLIESIVRKRKQLGELRPLAGPALLQLQRYYDVELTYTSNAIEGNTLTLRERPKMGDLTSESTRLNCELPQGERSDRKWDLACVRLGYCSTNSTRLL